MPGRPSKAVLAMKNKDYESTIWELLLHEYRCSKLGDTEHRLGSTSVAALIKALQEINTAKVKIDGHEATKDEVDEWLTKE